MTSKPTVSSDAFRLLAPLNDEEFAALKADVQRRGVQVPIEFDEEGHVLDGLARLRACRELGITDYPFVVRRGLSEAEKVDHRLKLNLLRRRLGPIGWAKAFDQLLIARGVARGQGARNDRTSASVAEVALELGVSPRTARYRLELADRLAGSPELVAAVDDGTLSASTALSMLHLAARRRTYAELPTPSLPTGPFGVVLGDPPWRYPEGDFLPGLAVEHHYPTLSTDEIAGYRDAEGRSVADLASPDAALFLWTTTTHLPDALRVMAAWGFEYFTKFTWVKPSIGLGFWVRNRHEDLLIGRRGTLAAPLPEARPDNVIEAPRGAHSAKPPIVYDLIEGMFPGLPKVELFARSQRPGWASFGNQLVAA